MEQATAGSVSGSHEVVSSPARNPLPTEVEPPRRERPVRVAVIASLFPPSVGGIQMHTLRLSQKLVELEAEVHVITRLHPGLAPFERIGGVRVHRVGAARATARAGSIAFVADAVRHLVRLRDHYDVIHAHQLLSPTTVALLSAPLVGRPIILNPHACGSIGDVGVLSRTAVGRLRLHAAMERADALVAVSRTIRDELIAAGASPNRVWTIGNGVDTERFSPCAIPGRTLLRRALGLPDAPLVVYTGRLSPEKGVDVLLAAWPTVVRRVERARLWIIGDGPEHRSLRAQAMALGVDGAVTFAGALSDVAPYVRAADAAALPSRTEGMPVALLEALSCATPVVATRVGGSAEVLEDGVTGRLVPPDAPEALASALCDALLDRATAERHGVAGRAQVLEQYSIRLVAERFLSLYRSVTAAHVAGSGAASSHAL